MPVDASSGKLITPPIQAYGYFFSSPNQPLEKKSFEISHVGSEEVVVKISGCGLCHTDIGFYKGDVKTKSPVPIILGHEISGTVIASGEQFTHLLNKDVVVPAVLPCGDCDLCKAGRDNVCQKQKMPGNDFNGGFASHIVVPARFLSPVPPLNGTFALADLSVIADAVTTPYQSLKRSRLTSGELAIVIGVGGIGTYMVQHALNVGATVVALDIDDNKLEAAKSQGAEFVFNVKSKSEKEIRDAVRQFVASRSLPKNGWKIFEMSGTGAVQTLAYSLLSYAGTLGIVGFTMDKLNLRLSNIMAFDADLFGNWGCRPALYAEVIQQVVGGKIKLKENILKFPLDSINEVLLKAMNHQLDRRAIFIP